MNFTIDNEKLSASLNDLESSSFTVTSIPRPYQVTWDATANPCDTINDLLAENSKNLLFIDEKVFELYGKGIKHPENQIFKAPATEVFKTLDGVMQLCDFLYQNDFTKGETLVVVGGGTIQDVGAFVGASYKRGINWVHFPTTLLSMSDSCIGGKSGVNYNGVKNQLALFSAPRAVIINPEFLNTLEKRDLQSGLGEILKLCITGGQTTLQLYDKHIKNGMIANKDDAKSLIWGALAVKKTVIERDEFELHLRKALNYGHTLGHALESISHYEIPHGIAVVVGMILVNHLSCTQGHLSRTECAEINALCFRLLDDDLLALLKKTDIQEVLRLLKQDKKVIGDVVTFVMLASSGSLNFVKMVLDQQLADQIADAFRNIFS
jgi:3-dehydroquinate synthase